MDSLKPARFSRDGDTMPEVRALLERAEELARIDELLEASRDGRGGLLLISGPAGIGKTSLLDACGDAAEKRGMSALRVRGDDVVMESSFAAVRELFWREVEAAGPEVLEGAARLAVPVLQGEAQGGGDRDHAAGVLHGLYWLVANLADRRPCVLSFDDAHWLDGASARFLVYLARRVNSLPVLLAVAMRPGERSDSDGLVAALSESAASVLRPAPLSEDGTAELVRRELGLRVDEEVCRSCHEATGGNPFYLRALTASIAAEGERPTADVARRVRSLGSGTLGSTVLVRLARVGSDAQRLAEALAVLGPGSPLRRVATLAGLGRDNAETAADSLRSVGLIATATPLSFAHPIVHEAIAAELPRSRLAALHLEAARLLFAEDAPADRVAAHLLSAEPYGEGWVVEALRTAARQALAQGAPEAAVSYLRRALAEPPAAEARVDVLVELGAAEACLPAAQDFAALREALALARDPRQRGEIAAELAWALISGVDNASARTLLEGVLETSDDFYPAVQERLEAILIGGGAADLSAEGMPDRVARNFERFKRGEVRDPVMLASLALTGAIVGLPAVDVAALARLAIRDRRLASQWWTAYTGPVVALSCAGRLDEAAQAADAGLADARRWGRAPEFAYMSILRARAASLAGELVVAEMHSQRGLELARELGPAAEEWATMWYGGTLLERGRAAEAAELLEAVQFDDALLGLWQGAVLLVDRGRVRAALGELELGVADLLDADRRMAAAGYHMSVLNDWVPTAALALTELGRGDEARGLARRELEDAVAIGAPRRHGIALSVCGLLETGPEGLARLREAVRILEGSPARLEHARALVNLGAGLRARGEREKAREPLAQGLDIAHRCSAEALAEQARAELVATGARPRRKALSGPASLTPAELRTARMAAEGLTNREIAQALFVSAKTVEWQLSHVYPKLGIHRRTELAAALGEARPRESLVGSGR